MPQRSDERLAELIATKILPGYPTRSVLDIGCGDGIISKHLDKGCKYTGLDISEACIYEKDQNNPNIQYVEADQITQVMNSGSTWETILLLDVIEHTRGFTTLFDIALEKATKHVIVSLPNELYILDRLRMLFGHEINAHSLDQASQPEGFKHQFIINISKARSLLERSASSRNFYLQEEVFRPLVAKRKFQQPLLWGLRLLSSDQLWSMGSIFIFTRQE